MSTSPPHFQCECNVCGLTFSTDLELFDHNLTWDHRVQVEAKRRQQVSPPVHPSSTARVPLRQRRKQKKTKRKDAFNTVAHPHALRYPIEPHYYPVAPHYYPITPQYQPVGPLLHPGHSLRVDYTQNVSVDWQKHTPILCNSKRKDSTTGQIDNCLSRSVSPSTDSGAGLSLAPKKKRKKKSKQKKIVDGKLSFQPPVKKASDQSSQAQSSKKPELPTSLFRYFKLEPPDTADNQDSSRELYLTARENPCTSLVYSQVKLEEDSMREFTDVNICDTDDSIYEESDMELCTTDDSDCPPLFLPLPPVTSTSESSENTSLSTTANPLPSTAGKPESSSLGVGSKAFPVVQLHGGSSTDNPSASTDPRVSPTMTVSPGSSKLSSPTSNRLKKPSTSLRKSRTTILPNVPLLDVRNDSLYFGVCENVQPPEAAVAHNLAFQVLQNLTSLSKRPLQQSPPFTLSNQAASSRAVEALLETNVLSYLSGVSLPSQVSSCSRGAVLKCSRAVDALLEPNVLSRLSGVSIPSCQSPPSGTSVAPSLAQSGEPVSSSVGMDSSMSHKTQTIFKDTTTAQQVSPIGAEQMSGTQTITARSSTSELASSHGGQQRMELYSVKSEPVSEDEEVVRVKPEPEDFDSAFGTRDLALAEPTPTTTYLPPPAPSIPTSTFPEVHVPAQHTTTLSDNGSKPMSFGDISHLEHTPPHIREYSMSSSSIDEGSPAASHCAESPGHRGSPSVRKLTFGEHTSMESSSVANQSSKARNSRKRPLVRDTGSEEGTCTKRARKAEAGINSSLMTEIEDLNNQENDIELEVIALRQNKNAVESLEKQQQTQYNTLKEELDSSSKKCDELKAKLEQIQHEFSSALATMVDQSKALSERELELKETKEQKNEIELKLHALSQNYSKVLKKKEMLLTSNTIRMAPAVATSTPIENSAEHSGGIVLSTIKPSTENRPVEATTPIPNVLMEDSASLSSDIGIETFDQMDASRSTAVHSMPSCGNFGDIQTPNAPAKAPSVVVVSDSSSVILDHKSPAAQSSVLLDHVSPAVLTLDSVKQNITTVTELRPQHTATESQTFVKSDSVKQKVAAVTKSNPQQNTTAVKSQTFLKSDSVKQKAAVTETKVRKSEMFVKSQSKVSTPEQKGNVSSPSGSPVKSLTRAKVHDTKEPPVSKPPPTVKKASEASTPSNSETKAYSGARVQQSVTLPVPKPTVKVNEAKPQPKVKAKSQTTVTGAKSPPSTKLTSTAKPQPKVKIKSKVTGSGSKSSPRASITDSEMTARAEPQPKDPRKTNSMVCGTAGAKSPPGVSSTEVTSQTKPQLKDSRKAKHAEVDSGAKSPLTASTEAKPQLPEAKPDPRAEASVDSPSCPNSTVSPSPPQECTAEGNEGGARKCPVFEPHSQPVLCLKTHSDYLFSGSSDHSLHVYNVTTGERLIRLPTYHDKAVNSIAVYMRGEALQIITGSSDKELHVYNIKRRKQVARFGVGEPVMAVTVSGDLLFIGFITGGVSVVDLSINKRILAVQSCHKNRISQLCVHEHYLITSSFDMSVSVWDFGEAIASGSEFALVKTIPLSNTPLCLKLHGPYLFVGCGDGKVCVYKTEDWSLSHTLVHKKPVSCVDVMGDIIITGCFDKVIRCYDIKTFQLLQQYCFKSTIYCVCCSNRQIIVGMDNGAVEAVTLDIINFHLCKWRGCGLKFGALEHLTMYHLQDHVNPNDKLPTECKWDDCSTELNPSEMLAHLKKHTSTQV